MPMPWRGGAVVSLARFAWWLRPSGTSPVGCPIARTCSMRASRIALPSWRRGSPSWKARSSRAAGSAIGWRPDALRRSVRYAQDAEEEAGQDRLDAEDDPEGGWDHRTKRLACVDVAPAGVAPPQERHNGGRDADDGERHPDREPVLQLDPPEPPTESGIFRP